VGAPGRLARSRPACKSNPYINLLSLPPGGIALLGEFSSVIVVLARARSLFLFRPADSSSLLLDGFPRFGDMGLGVQELTHEINIRLSLC
jgi:hypothetical protein